MRPFRQFVAGLVLCAAAAPGVLSQQTPSQPARAAREVGKPVTLVVGSPVAADKVMTAFQVMGPVMVRTGLIKDVGRRGGVNIRARLEKNDNFKLDTEIEDAERRSATFMPTTAAKLAQQIDYFIFLNYTPAGSGQITVVGTLTKLASEGSYFVTSEDAVVDPQNPQLTTLGQKLYIDILRTEDPNYAPHNFSLVFCSGKADDVPAANLVRSEIKDSLTDDKLNLEGAITIKGRACVEDEAGSANEILVHFRTTAKVGIEVELTSLDNFIVHGTLYLVANEFEAPYDCEERMKILIQNVLKSYVQWILRHI